ncbi:Uu.00g145250.m01.CDS01 [Anthostomella pinea]|uniref:Uu.00g145250.m01.CDS01 n=1 Tax=Anthostomella pinea TaxID=933095 RepID=A0AAI8YLV8_9PEZI|nr:Uu.00g145250.m01.CDS01 [Anthostomella pinea]
MYIALVYGLLYTWSEGLPILFTENYGFSLRHEGVALLGILYIEPQFNEDGQLKPDDRVALYAHLCVLLFNSVMNYLSDAFPDKAASISAGNVFLKRGIVVESPLFATAMYESRASSTLACISVAILPVPFMHNSWRVVEAQEQARETWPVNDAETWEYIRPWRMP